MRNKTGFDTDKYLNTQINKLSQKLLPFKKLYLEFGGKLFSDSHAARVLPGYRPGAKIELLKKLGNIDLFYCISAKDIAKGRISGASGLVYDNQALKDIDNIVDYGLKVSGVIITRFEKQPSAEQFIRKLQYGGINTYIQKTIEGYPENIEKILEGYQHQPYVKTKGPLVVVTGTGSGSGKMAFCISQIYHERKHKIKSGFAKFETFPIWNLSLNHPINTAYEAATADIKDFNQIDPYHKKEYGISSINYNRDIENFSILKELLKNITGEKYPFGYRSPTDMGVNTVADGIVNDKICREAALQEIIRRYFRYLKERAEGGESQETVDRVKKIMKKLKLKPEQRRIVYFARKAAKEAPKTQKGFKGVFSGAAIELKDGRIVTGKNSAVLHAESAAILNAVKVLNNIPDEIDLISTNFLNEISHMKGNLENYPSLTVNETLIALAASSAVNPSARAALEKINEIKGCEMHVTTLPSEGDETGLRILNINLTTDALIPSLKLFRL